jgi:hypothetical protein
MGSWGSSCSPSAVAAVLLFCAASPQLDLARQARPHHLSLPRLCRSIALSFELCFNPARLSDTNTFSTSFLNNMLLAI